jgi:hypothetical protein
MISISLVEQLLLAGPTCRGPAQCKHSPCTIKGRVHPLEDKVQQPETQPIQHQSGRRVLRSGGPNHSKSSCPSCVHLSTDRALLSLLQTHPKLGLGGCFPPPGWRIPPTVTYYGSWFYHELTNIIFMLLIFIFFNYLWSKFKRFDLEKSKNSYILG